MPTISPSDAALLNLEGILPVTEREKRPAIPDGWISISGKPDANGWAETIFHPPTGEVRKWVIDAHKSEWKAQPGDYRFSLVAIIKNPDTGEMQSLSPINAPTEATAKRIAGILAFYMLKSVNYEPLPDNPPYYRTAPAWSVSVEGIGMRNVSTLIAEVWSIGSESSWINQVKAKGGWLS